MDIRAAGHIGYMHFGIQRLEFLNQLRPGHLRHHDIRQQKINIGALFPADFQSFGPAEGLQNFESPANQKSAGDGQDGLFVVDDEYGLNSRWSAGDAASCFTRCLSISGPFVQKLGISLGFI